jgi:two-component system sensor histidine kinase SenX3
VPPIVVLFAGVVIGLAIGVVLARRVIDDNRSGRRSHASNQPTRAPVAAADNVADKPVADLALGLQSAVDRLQMGVVMCDASLKTTYRNGAADALTGTHAGVIVDSHLQQLFIETRSGERAGRIVELQGPPKTTFSIDAMPIPRGGAVATIDDISERVRIDSMRTDFVANISHELKTPVGAIAVLAEMLADETDQTVINTLSTRVVEESHRAARTIDDLLKLSRIELSHRLDDEVDLTAVVGEAVARGRMAANGHQVQVETVDTADRLWIRADRAQLISAIGNLVENAVKYSDDGSLVQVRIRRNERWVEVMVVDQGVGIPAADLDRVFERFYRVDKARARQTGGTGLGLAIVRHVANNHGGAVSVQSQEGEGSTFTFRLPARLLGPGPEADELADQIGVQPASGRPAVAAESSLPQKVSVSDG